MHQFKNQSTYKPSLLPCTFYNPEHFNQDTPIKLLSSEDCVVSTDQPSQTLKQENESLRRKVEQLTKSLSFERHHSTELLAQLRQSKAQLDKFKKQQSSTTVKLRQQLEQSKLLTRSFQQKLLINNLQLKEYKLLLKDFKTRYESKTIKKQQPQSYVVKHPLQTSFNNSISRHLDQSQTYRSRTRLPTDTNQRDTIPSSQRSRKYL